MTAAPPRVAFLGAGAMTRPSTAADVAFALSVNALHAEHAVAALDAGLDVVVEKPFALTLDGAEAIRAASGGRVVGYAENHAFAPAVRRLRALVAGGAVGTPRRARARFVVGGPAPGSWHRRPALSGGGSLVDLGSHAVQTALYALGSPAVRRVERSRLAFAGDGTEVGAEAAFACDGPGGAVELAVETSWAAPPGGETCVYEVEGDAGAVRATLFPGLARIARTDARGATHEEPVPEALDPSLRALVDGQGYATQAAHFFEAVQTREPPAMGLAEGAQTLRLLLVAARAAARSGAVDVADPLPSDLSPAALYAAEAR